MPDDLEFDEYKFRVSRHWSTWQDAVKGALEGSAQALRALLLVNGGAAVALLAFLGNVAARPNAGVHVSAGGLRWALMLFLLGVSASTLAYGLRWGAAYGDAVAHRLLLERVIASRFTKEPPDFGRVNLWSWGALIMTLAAMLVGLSSLGAFFCGGVACYRSIS